MRSVTNLRTGMYRYGNCFSMLRIMDEKKTYLTWIMSRKCLLLALPFLLIIFCLSLTPVIERDALIHHLALPKIWLKNGVFKIDTFRDCSKDTGSLSSCTR